MGAQRSAQLKDPRQAKGKSVAAGLEKQTRAYQMYHMTS